MSTLPTLKQLQYFVALAETGHYRRAAEREGITQSSLSQQISNLEETLRLRLVERGRAGALLTPEGQEVLARARTIVEGAIGLADLSERMKSGLAGTLRLGSSPTLGPYLLPPVLRYLHELYPDLKLIIQEAPPRELLDGLRDGRHDMILTQLPVEASDVVVNRLFREPLRLVGARDHPLAGRAVVEDADLAEESILTLPTSFALHDQLAELAREVGAHVNYDYQGTSLDALRQMAAMNMGLTILPALYVHSEISEGTGDVAVMPFREGRLSRSIGLCWRRSSSDHTGYYALTQAIRSVAQTRFGELVRMET